MTRSLVSVLVLWALPAVAQPWIPSECGSQHEPSWEKFDRAVRTAPPASDLYVPRPFPQNEADLVIDLVFGYERMWRGTAPEEMPEDESPLFEAIRAGNVSYRILRVENWTLTRCLPERRQRHHFLLYVDDRESGKEIGRFVLHETGLLYGWTTPPRENEQRRRFEETRVPELGLTIAEVRRRFGITPERAQLGTTWGTLDCPVFSPCVAFQAQSRTYLYRLGELFEHSPSARTYSRSALEPRDRRAAVLAALKPDERLTSVGADRWVVVRRVAPGSGSR